MSSLLQSKRVRLFDLAWQPRLGRNQREERRDQIRRKGSPQTDTTEQVSLTKGASVWLQMFCSGSGTVWRYCFHLGWRCLHVGGFLLEFRWDGFHFWRPALHVRWAHAHSHFRSAHVQLRVVRFPVPTLVSNARFLERHHLCQITRVIGSFLKPQVTLIFHQMCGNPQMKGPYVLYCALQRSFENPFSGTERKKSATKFTYMRDARTRSPTAIAVCWRHTGDGGRRAVRGVTFVRPSPTKSRFLLTFSTWAFFVSVNF